MVMRTRDADRLAESAAELVVMVRDECPTTVANLLATLDRNRLENLTIALAAMCPDDKPLSELLAWCDPNRQKRETAQRLAELRANNVRTLAPHGTHAAFTRHKSTGQEPCALCREGERTYQRERKRRNRAEQLAEQAS